MAKGKEVYIDDDGDDGVLGFCASQGFHNLNSVCTSEPNQQQQGRGDLDLLSFKDKSTLGLKLTMTDSFLSLLEQELLKSSANSNKKMKMTHEGSQNSTKNVSSYEARMDNFVSQPISEKLKASNFPAEALKIGNWECYSKHEGDLMAKCYYAKRKLVWEVLEGGLKRKIEMHWSDIVGIRAVIRENEPGLLEIELNKEPKFFRETTPQPRKHTLWLPAADFTGGHALMCRRHTAIFRPGYLDKNYEKLLQCDPKLLMLSQQPFPTQEYPYFPQDNSGYFDSDRFGQHSRVPSIPMPASQGHDSNIPMSVMDHQHENQRMDWNQGLGNGFLWRENGSGLSKFDLAAERFNPNTRNILPNHIENHSQVPFKNTNAIVPNVGNNVGYQPPMFTSFGNNSAIVSPNTTNVGNNVGYQPPTITSFGNNSVIVSPNTTTIVGNNDAYQSPTIITSFGNTSPIGTVTNVGNNIEYQPHILTGFGFSPLPIEIDYQPRGDYEVSPQQINESPYEHQLPPLPFQDYELPYEYQLPPQPFQDYANQLLNTVTSSSSTESSIEKFAALDAIQDVENIG